MVIFFRREEQEQEQEEEGQRCWGCLWGKEEFGQQRCVLEMREKGF